MLDTTYLLKRLPSDIVYSIILPMVYDELLYDIHRELRFRKHKNPEKFVMAVYYKSPLFRHLYNIKLEFIQRHYKYRFRNTHMFIPSNSVLLNVYYRTSSFIEYVMNIERSLVIGTYYKVSIGFKTVIYKHRTMKTFFRFMDNHFKQIHEFDVDNKYNLIFMK